MIKNTTYSWNTASVIRETDDAVTITFDTNGQHFFYKPGQFINVQHSVGKEAVSRSYSLSSSPDEDEKPSITIKKVAGGKMSNYIFHHAEDIGSWEIDGPHGSFYADGSSLKNKPIVLIGGGSGITPLYSILKTMLRHAEANILLIDCNRTWNDVVFAKGLTYLERVYSDRFQVIHFLSREAERTDFPGKNFRTEKTNQDCIEENVKELAKGEYC